MLNIKAACLGCHKRHDAKVTAEDLRLASTRSRTGTGRCARRRWTRRGGADRRPEGGEGGGRDGRRSARRPLPAARSQFYLDFVEAENSTGFHAPQEAARILGESIDFARQGQIALRDPSFKPTVAIVDIPPPPKLPPLTPPTEK